LKTSIQFSASYGPTGQLILENTPSSNFSDSVEKVN